MSNTDLIIYIRNEREKGTPESKIRSDLLENGWNNDDINEANRALSGNLQIDLPEKNTSKLLPEEDQDMSLLEKIARVVGSIIILIFVALGVVFGGCLILLSMGNL